MQSTHVNTLSDKAGVCVADAGFSRMFSTGFLGSDAKMQLKRTETRGKHGRNLVMVHCFTTKLFKTGLG